MSSHNKLSFNLKFVTFPGGTRGYGIYVPRGTFTPPLREEMVNNLPDDYAKTVVYPVYREILNAESKEKNWTSCGVCPDAIYLSLYAYNHGIGPSAQEPNTAATEVPFPGNFSSANSLFSPVSSQRMTRFMIYASLHPETCGGGRLFNTADNEVPCKYGELWPRLAAWFGLKGTGPAEISTTQDNTLKVGELSKLAQQHRHQESTSLSIEIFLLGKGARMQSAKVSDMVADNWIVWDTGRHLTVN